MRAGAAKEVCPHIRREYIATSKVLPKLLRLLGENGSAWTALLREGDIIDVFPNEHEAYTAANLKLGYAVPYTVVDVSPHDVSIRIHCPRPELIEIQK